MNIRRGVGVYSADIYPNFEKQEWESNFHYAMYQNVVEQGKVI
jgi:hypothetical protein